MADKKFYDTEGNIIESSSILNTLNQSELKQLSEGQDNESTSVADAEKRKFNKDGDSGGGGGSEGDDGGTKKQKISIGFTRTFGAVRTVQEKKNPTPITIKLGSQKIKEPQTAIRKTSASVAEAFNQESDEEEEMPPEAKMRMRNIGRDTPTSAGPNSFGKTRQGFCDAKKVFERQLRKQMEEVGGDN